jgi:hypothetical protein
VEPASLNRASWCEVYFLARAPDSFTGFGGLSLCTVTGEVAHPGAFGLAIKRPFYSAIKLSTFRHKLVISKSLHVHETSHEGTETDKYIQNIISVLSTSPLKLTESGDKAPRILSLGTKSR